MIHSCLVCVRATCFCFFFFIFLLTRSVTERGMPRTTGTLQWRLRVVLRPQSQVQRRIPESIIDPRQKQIVFSASLQPICLTNKVRADNFVLPLITVNLLLSAVCVCVYMLSFFYILLHLLVSPRSAITKPMQRTETPQFPSLLACSHLHRASLKCVDEFSCPEPLSAPYSHVSLSEVEGDRRRSLLLRGALQGACRGSGSP